MASANNQARILESAPQGSPRASETGAQVLAVDDDARMLDSIRSLLVDAGYEVATASSAREAMTRLGMEHYDLVLLDLRMQDLDGHQVMDFIVDGDIDTTVIVVSGDASIDAAIESLRRGAHDFVRKPYAPEELMKRVENALRKRRLEHENARMRDRLERSQRLYRYMVNSSPDMVYMLDNQGRFTFLNDKVEGMLGFSREQLIGKHFSVVVHEDDLDKARYIFNERRAGPRATRNAELRLRSNPQDGGSRQFDSELVPVELNSLGVYSHKTQQARFLGTYGVARDISDRKRAERTIKYQAYHDLLTGLPNRTLFEDHLNLALAQAGRYSQLLSVMFLDLDRFKVVNDTLGHVMGDRLLRVVSSRLKDSLRKGDTLARIGGDEFLLLLPQVRSRLEVETVARKIIEALKSPFVIDGYEFFVGCSIGITVFPDDGTTRDALIKNADIAMYHVKGSGKGSYQFYSGAMDDALSNQVSMETELRKALDSDQFTVLFQPQVDTRTGQIVGLEALSRWRHPRLGTVSPSEFISLAEDTGLITAVGERLLRMICAEMKHWQSLGLPRTRVAVNLSALEVVHRRFVDLILRLLDEYELPGESLEIEITESIIVRDLENVARKLRELSDHGVTVAIDDFGTGYSSLTYLKKLPIHTLKIDRAFVNDISPEQGDEASIVAAIVSMAEGLGLQVIAEGVETPFQRNYLESLGCRSMQGFLFSEPISGEPLMEVLRTRRLES
ncbi:MAG: EAL domain-containing protein [Chromatiales bacterium]|jgi:diguanylate cyclase (GGDEF)-like protein/PAS domain S-box-containing protein